MWCKYNFYMDEKTEKKNNVIHFITIFYVLWRSKTESTILPRHPCVRKYLLLLLLSCFSHVRLCVTPERQPSRLPRPWDSPGKNTGVSCHFLPQCMKVKSESEVAQSCLTPSDPMDCSPPGSSVHGICQARVLE